VYPSSLSSNISGTTPISIHAAVPTDRPY
jgi:hypothetical protein